MKLAIRTTAGNRTLTVDTVPEASRALRAFLDARNIGGSQFKAATLADDEGAILFRLSYNGKVWRPAPWVPGALPIYDPYAA